MSSCIIFDARQTYIYTVRRGCASPSLSGGFLSVGKMFTPTDLVLILFTLLALVLTVCALLAFACAACFRVSRPYLNRVSFRLLIYALIGNLIYMTFIAAAPLGPHGTSIGDRACSFIAFFSNFGLLFSAYMFAAMALNLALVLVFEVNGQRMEKYYVLGAFLLCAICSIVPRFDDICWLKPSHNLGWVIGTQTLWILLASAVEFGICLLVIIHMLQYQRASRLARRRTAIPPLIMYRRLILRVALYPLISCALNISTNILDLHLLTDFSDTPEHQRLAVLSSMLYSLRQVLYAVLALTDPSFIRAASALLKRTTPRRGTSQDALASLPKGSAETSLSKDSEAGSSAAPSPTVDIRAQI
ncbi:hypothetical protein C8J57DRAFT_1712621 [Mycena rebaudengoi]|nr:hypothetical protein C8J57DRAFT_1712621 [Mycena rebaudengoi]